MFQHRCLESVLTNCADLVLILSFSHFWHAQLEWVHSTKCNLHSGRFWATIASFGDRLLDFRSCWMVLVEIETL